MTSAARAHRDDPTCYPVEEKVGGDSLHTLIVELCRQLVDRWLVEQGKPTFVGADQFIYWVQFHPHKCVAPDVYVLPGFPRDGRLPCLKVWEERKVPSLAVEVVSAGSVEKDYRDAPGKYDELGVKELVVFDPDFAEGPDRLRFQVFRRVRSRGLVRVTGTNEDRVQSRVLGCHLRAVGTGAETRLRVASGEHGDALFPTDAEVAVAERARADQAEAEVARLQAELAGLRKA